ncbi:MAG: aminoacyl-tRNA deacylase [Chloroflexi bacterium]|nr:aminoacyl-tRNA deacylase [Chloroflexota bacterium]
MVDKTEKTNAMRLLEGKRVVYTAHHWTYAADQHAAGDVAVQLGLPPAQVFKTLVVLSPTPKARPLLVIVGGDREVDLKKLAAAAAEKKLAMATQREAETLTGLQVGGISALALINKGYRIYLDAAANAWPTIVVSAGQRGVSVQLGVADLVKVTGARVADVSRPLSSAEA